MTFADQHERPYAGMNLAEGNALQMQLCSLKPRKSMADYDKVMNAYIKWSKDNNAELYVLRATPLFVSSGPDVPEFEWLDMLASSFQASGDGWHKWMTTEQGQKLNEQWLETADCQVSINAAYARYIDREALSGDTRVMTMNWCTRHEGVSSDQLFAKHDEIAARRGDDSPVKAWNIMVPALGARNAPGDFAHMLTFADMNGLMAYQNGIANQEGWRMIQDYNASYASCTGDNAYYVTVLNRP
jgi:hypothetical protein